MYEDLKPPKLIYCLFIYHTMNKDLFLITDTLSLYLIELCIKAIKRPTNTPFRTLWPC